MGVTRENEELVIGYLQYFGKFCENFFNMKVSVYKKFSIKLQ
jgi:hypothetical protein